MTTTNDYNYLEAPYLQGEYTQVQSTGADGWQFNAVITSGIKLKATQFSGQITDGIKENGNQFEAVISDYSTALATQNLAIINDFRNTHGTQFKTEITNALAYIGSQFQAIVEEQTTLGSQALTIVTDGSISLGTQFNAEVATIESMAVQFNGVVSTIDANGVQFNGEINAIEASATQTQGQIAGSNELATQFSSQITDGISANANQFQSILTNEGIAATQFTAVPREDKSLGTQFDVELDSGGGSGNQFLFNHVTHAISDYLVQDYLVDPYLVKSFRALQRTQFKAQITNGSSAFGNQFLAAVRTTDKFAVQFKSIISAQKATGWQFESVFGMPIATQFRSVLYNTRNLRILWQFPSRGLSVSAWAATSSEPGDFGIENVNNDLVEKIWRSQTGSITGVKLTCDTGLAQGVFLDTLAILNHNMTRSAVFVVEGTNDPTYSTIGFAFTMPIETTNMYYIASELPLTGYRYWRFSVDDPTNSDNYIKIGCILFGQSTIWSGECFSNPVRFSKTHFTDQVFTEGYTNVSNDRGIKKKIGLDFQNINFNGGNYEGYTEMVETIRTSLKALWIPTPQYASRYAIFGKLTEIPQETHTDNGENADYVDFSVEIDEAK